MDVDAFEATLQHPEPPAGLSVPLLALWHAGSGDWQRAHEIVLDERDAAAAWVHAFLHREEGDLANAGYWYRRAGRHIADGDLELEFRQIAAELLGGR
ncbi:MAG: hypothetical protein IPM29_07090 [Planctomycetes bacterium]|nr:hypothetical protein [Planctomycetota bacterium]